MGFYDILWDCYQPNGMIHDDFWGFIQKYVSSTFMMISEDSSTCRTSSLRRLPRWYNHLHASYKRPGPRPRPRRRGREASRRRTRSCATSPLILFDTGDMHQCTLARSTHSPKSGPLHRPPGLAPLGWVRFHGMGWTPGAVWGNFRVYVARPRFLEKLMEKYDI